MNDFTDPNQTQPTPEPPPAAPAAGFCQHCGKPLTTETIRRVGTAVYCEPCLAARIGATPPGAGGPSAGYRPVNFGSQRTVVGWTTGELNAPGPNPGLAALLGLIPGVGAMYNEQYAKGIVHLIVFAVLVSLADNVNGIFTLFIFGWVAYMAIEAHHTARARRDGTPLPNPFGLNDIGERLGFGKAWPTGPTVSEVASDAAAAAAAAAAHASAGFAPYPPPASQQPSQTTPPTAASPSWGAPTDAYAQAAYTQPFVNATYAQAYRDMGYGQPPADAPWTTPSSAASSGVPPYNHTPVPPYAPIPPFDPAAAYVAPPSRFPAGAVVLIGLGTIFLLTTAGVFNGFPPEALVGCVMLGICAWIFLRRMMETGPVLASDPTVGYGPRIMRALRVSIYIGGFGVLFLLDAFHILTWRHSWPFLIILPGVMAIVERATYQATLPYMPPAPPVTVAADSSKGGK
jgi:hypothetical protein